MSHFGTAKKHCVQSKGAFTNHFSDSYRHYDAKGAGGGSEGVTLIFYLKHTLTFGR